MAPEGPVQGSSSATSVRETDRTSASDPRQAPSSSTEAHFSALTGEDVVLGPNAPVGAVRSHKAPATDTSRDSAEASHFQGEKRELEFGDGLGHASTEKTKGDGAGENGQEVEDETKYPGGVALSILTFGLCMATFVVALDNTIIGRYLMSLCFILMLTIPATAIPRITTVFNSLNDVGWYGSSYLLTTTSLQPSFGKIYTYFNVKYTFISALIIFEIGSVICAAARNSVMLIIGRAVAGVGASALFSGGMTIIGFSVPLRRRAIYIALLSSMFGISSVVGPILGGVLTDRATWRWCFWINLPFGGVALLTVFFFFKNPAREHSDKTFKEKIQEIDLLGAFFLICAIVCLLLALQWGGSTYPWRNSKVWGLFLGFGLLIAVFIALQFKLGDRYVNSSMNE